MEVGKLLTSTLDLHKILKVIMQKVSHYIDAENWSLLLRDESSGDLVFEIVVGESAQALKGYRLPPGEGIAHRSVETGEPLFVMNVKDTPHFSESADRRTGFRTESLVCIPLRILGKVLGVIEIVNIRDMDRFQSDDLPFMRILADYAAIAIQNSKHFERIRNMSITDEYTGLYNARYLHETVEKLIEETQGEGSGFAIVFVDIDNFKKVVDRYGHLLGTQVLREIGQTMLSCLSEKDILIKYGGDEYVIIYPGLDKEAAIERTRTILEAMRGSVYLKSEQQPVTLTASFGIAAYPEDASSKKDIFILADNFMYDVKHSSKNDIGYR